MKLWHLAAIMIGGAEALAITVVWLRDRAIRRKKQQARVRPRLIVIDGGKKRRVG